MFSPCLSVCLSVCLSFILSSLILSFCRVPGFTVDGKDIYEFSKYLCVPCTLPVSIHFLCLQDNPRRCSGIVQFDWSNWFMSIYGRSVDWGFDHPDCTPPLKINLKLTANTWQNSLHFGSHWMTFKLCQSLKPLHPSKYNWTKHLKKKKNLTLVF